MMTTALVLEIRRLLDEGRLSQRQIARRLGVSRGSVSAIAQGRRGLHGRESEMGARGPRESQRLPTRCRSCGGMVYEPCLLCAARAYCRRAAAARFESAPRPVPRQRRVA